MRTSCNPRPKPLVATPFPLYFVQSYRANMRLYLVHPNFLSFYLNVASSRPYGITRSTDSRFRIFWNDSDRSQRLLSIPYTSVIDRYIEFPPFAQEAKQSCFSIARYRHKEERKASLHCRAAYRHTSRNFWLAWATRPLPYFVCYEGLAGYLSKSSSLETCMSGNSHLTTIYSNFIDV